MSTIALDDRWMIGGHINGGYLAAVCGQVASEALGGAHVLTISTHFLEPVNGGGEVEVALEETRRGRLSTARVSMRRGDLLLLDSFVTLGTPRPSEPLIDRARPSHLPPFDQCPDARQGDVAPEGFEMLDHVLLRVHPDVAAAMSGGSPLEHAVVTTYLAYRDGHHVDDLLAMAAWDCGLPTTWVSHIWGPAPTVNSQVVLYPGEIEGPLILEARCDTLDSGIIDETARVWDATGRLVSSSRQTALHIAS